MNDADLVSRIASKGDIQAEAELCRRMGHRIRLYGLKHLRNTEAADDLMQQVLLTMIEALRAGKLRDPEKLASFVLGTCRMTVLDTRRNAQRREKLLGEFGLQSLRPVALTMPDLDEQRLAGCVQSLKERERTVVILTFYDEQSGADVGRFLGVTEANVRVIRHRAVRQLRGCMGAVA
ncbi:MAG TPA: sigma-70 family RNA polymerase sigma factor [Bryobacteraceae bacterium]